MKDSYLKIASDLIEIPSSADNSSALSRVVDYAEKYYAGAGAHTVRYEHAQKPSLVVATDEGFSFDVILSGHLDVVEGSEESFSPRIENGRLYGRGAADMKSETAVMMQTMKEILEEQKAGAVVPKTALILTTDEESGGANGAEYLVDNVGYRAKAVFVPDGGDDLDQVVVTAKGFLHVRIAGEGAPAHGSRPWLGENAIMKVVRASQAVFNAFSVPECRDDGSDDDAHWHSTCVLGKFSGGTAANTIPKHAECEISIRFVEPDTVAEAFGRVRKLAEENGCAVKLLASGEMRITPEDDRAVEAYRKVVEREIGIVPRLRRTHGADDGRFFSRHGIPVIMTRPRSGGQHGENEWVDVASLGDFYRITRGFVDFFRSTPPQLSPLKKGGGA